MEIIDSVEVKTVKSIMQIGGGEYEACALGKTSGDVEAVDFTHLDIKKYKIGTGGDDMFKPFRRIGEHTQFDAAYSPAEFFNHLQSQRLIVDCYTPQVLSISIEI